MTLSYSNLQSLAVSVVGALLAASLFVALNLIGAPLLVGAAVATIAGFALRGGAMIWGWSLPAYKD